MKDITSSAIVLIRLRAKRFGETRRSLGEGGRVVVCIVGFVAPFQQLN